VTAVTISPRAAFPRSLRIGRKIHDELASRLDEEAQSVFMPHRSTAATGSDFRPGSANFREFRDVPRVTSATGFRGKRASLLVPRFLETRNLAK